MLVRSWRMKAGVEDVLGMRQIERSGIHFRVVADAGIGLSDPDVLAAGGKARPRAQDAAVARALDVVGEWWTLLILRDAFLGVRRFDDFVERLGIARNVLTARLERLVEEDILERRPYQTNPERHEYFLTEKGLDALREETREKIADWNRFGRELCGRFIDQVPGYRCEILVGAEPVLLERGAVLVQEAELTDGVWTAVCEKT